MITTQTFLQYISTWLAEYASETGTDPVIPPGDPTLALAECAANMATYLQFQAVGTINFARLTTSTGPDVDSFCAQFNFPRLGAQLASGQVTLAINSPSSVNITIPIGVVVQTTGGNIQYQLIADTNQAAYNAALQAYVLPSSTSSSPVLSIAASVQALVPGSASNVQSGQLSQFGSGSSGVTSVSNNAPITNGADQESDNAYKARFQAYIQSLSKATYLAILETCQTTFPDFTYTILNNTTQTGASQPGWFTVIANNPGQTVTSPQLAALQAAVNLVRAFTIQSSVIAAIPVKPNITLNVSVVSGSNLSNIESVVQTAIIGYVNNLPTGATLYLSNLIDVAINSSTLITSIEFSSVTVNTIPRDFIPGKFQVVQADTLTVLVGAYSG